MKTVLSQTVLAFILVFNSSTTTVFAADFAVNTTDDAVDQNTADGDCLTAAGKCSLRAAIQQANDSPGADRVILPVGTFYIEIIGAGE